MGEVGWHALGYVAHLAVEQHCELLGKVGREVRLVLVEQLGAHARVSVAHVVEQVCQDAREVGVAQVCMSDAVLVDALEDAVEHLHAHLFQQVVLCLEVSVKGAAADVGALDDLRYRDVAVVCACHERLKGVVDGLPGLALASVHGVSSSSFEAIRVYIDAYCCIFLPGHFYISVPNHAHCADCSIRHRAIGVTASVQGGPIDSSFI